MRKPIKLQPRKVIGPFTQAEMLEAKAKGAKLTVFKPWKTGKTYPYRSAKRGGLSWHERQMEAAARIMVRDRDILAALATA